MMKRVMLLMMLPLMISGCSDSAKVALHEPGQYKGKTDPLLAASMTSEHRERLRDRLERIETDR
jgi:hypothetical protein